jgi:hypothetical protein
MVLVRETVDRDWRALRDIRLEALRAAPTPRALRALRIRADR